MRLLKGEEVVLRSLWSTSWAESQGQALLVVSGKALSDREYA